MARHNIIYPPWGWENVCTKGANELHVIPLNDDRLHDVGSTLGCWCEPEPDEEDATVIRHNAADGREAFETYQRLPS